MDAKLNRLNLEDAIAAMSNRAYGFITELMLAGVDPEIICECQERAPSVFGILDSTFLRSHQGRWPGAKAARQDTDAPTGYQPGDYKKARGILADTANEPAEDSIRRLRDGDGKGQIYCLRDGDLSTWLRQLVSSLGRDGHDVPNSINPEHIRLNSMVECILFEAVKLGFPDPFENDDDYGNALYDLIEWLSNNGNDK